MVQRCFVAGYPIAHSRSPLIHGRWIAERGLDATYERLEIRPEDVPKLLDAVRSGHYLGGNLTIPLKQAALPLLDRLTPQAAAMGAVNTIYLEDGMLTGANTDIDGFLAHLDLTCPGWDAKPVSALLIGAGGAARAIAHGLMTRNLHVLTVTNRSQERAVTMLEGIAGPGTVPFPSEILPWPVAPDALSASGLIINATSLGMKGQAPLELDWPESLPAAIAYDIVYSPLVTPFLDQAQARGARVVDGLGMLLHQASLAFGHWFGDIPVVTPELRAVLEADLALEQRGGR